MAVDEVDRKVGRLMFEVAIGMVATRETAVIAQLAQNALEHPSPSTIRALLAIGQGRPWLDSVVNALAEVGIAAIDEVLK